METVMNRICGILDGIRPEFAQEFASSDDFFADGLLDSFDLITLVSDLDRSFGISIDGMQIVPENFRNLQAIEALLVKCGASA